MLHCLQHGLFGDLMKDDAILLIHVQPQHAGQMPGNRFSLTVWIACQIDVIAVLRQLLQLFDNVLLIGADLVVRLKIMFHIDAQAALAARRQISYMSLAGYDMIVVAQIFFDGLGLGR